MHGGPQDPPVGPFQWIIPRDTCSRLFRRIFRRWGRRQHMYRPGTFRTAHTICSPDGRNDLALSVSSRGSLVNRYGFRNEGPWQEDYEMFREDQNLVPVHH